MLLNAQRTLQDKLGIWGAAMNVWQVSAYFYNSISKVYISCFSLVNV